MKRGLGILTTILIAFALFSSCSSDGKVLATYSDGKKNYTVKIGDVKQEILMYVTYKPDIINDLNWHKDYFFDRYISLDAAFIEAAATGITNNPDFIKNYNGQIDKLGYGLLYQKGDETLKKTAKNAKYKIVKVSHILLMANKYTNINGATKEISEAEYQKRLTEKENRAMNIIDSLKMSKSLDKDFSNVAAQESEDTASAKSGGDLSYFTKSMMVAEFEAAAFEAKGKGLINKPVKTTYGYHILYVTDPAVDKTMPEIQGKVGKDIYKKLEPYFQTSFNDNDRKEKVKDLYTADTNKNALVVDGQSYSANALPDNLKIIKVYNKDYSWKETRDIIALYVPGFETNVSAVSIQREMENLKRFIYVVDAARNAGIEKTDAYKKELDKSKDSYMKRMAAQTLQQSFNDKAKAMITPAAIQEFYQANKPSLMKDVKGKQVQMNLKESEERIKGELQNTNLKQIYQEWKDQIKTKLKVVYIDAGIRDLFKLESKALSDKQKKDAEQQKKSQQQQQPKK